MALFHGKNAMVTWNSGDITYATEWTIDAQCAMADTTAFGDAGVATFAAGVTSWTASVTALHTDSGPAATLGQSATIEGELVNAGDKYSGTGLCSGRSVSTGVGGMVTITYQFQGTGALTAPS